jgi:hypothetical protein
MIAFCLGALAVALAVTVTARVCRRLPAVAGAVPWLATLITVVVAVIAFFDRPYGSGADELIYQGQAEGVRLSLVLTGGFDPVYALLDSGKAGWPTVLGFAYFIAGTDNPFLGVVINAVVAYLAIFLAVAAGARLHPTMRWREWFGILLITSPQLVLVGPTLLREGWAWLSGSIAIHGLIWLVRGKPWTGSLTVLGGVLIAFWIRTPLAPILVAAIFAGVLISSVWRRHGTKRAVLAFVALGLTGRLALTVMLGAVGYSPEQLFIVRDSLADLATTGFSPADPFTPIGLIESFVRVGLGPLPWEFRPAPAWAWVFVNWAYWAVLVVAAWRGLRRTGTNQVSVAIIAFSVVLLAGLAVGLTNYGIVVRMRATVIVALIPLAMGLLVPARDRDPEHAEAT